MKIYCKLKTTKRNISNYTINVENLTVILVEVEIEKISIIAST